MLLDKLNGTATSGTSDRKSCLYIGQYFGATKPAKFAKLTQKEQDAFFADKDTIEEMQAGRTMIEEICTAIGYKRTKSDALEENGSAIFTAMLHYIAGVQAEKEAKSKK